MARIKATRDEHMNAANLEHFTQLTSRREVLGEENCIADGSVIDWIQICCQIQKHTVKISDAMLSGTTS